MSFVCDCQQLHTPLPSNDVLVFSPSAHISRRLSLLCGEKARYQSGPGWRLSGSVTQLVQRITALAEALKPNEREQVQILPLVENQLIYWHSLQLPLWLKLQHSAWFPEALSQLRVAFQPVFDLRSGAVFGFEALIRAQVGERLYGAGELLSAAPAHGGLYVFDRQARQAAIVQGAALTEQNKHLLINFMPGTVYDPEVCLNTTFRACQASQIDPSRLIFEVVETEACPDLELLRSVLNRYRREGMQVALDDLGAGHNSLVYLEALRPDLVKLDKSLMIGITPDDPRTALVAALVRYAHELGIQVVAEGLETATELDAAFALGADLGQGYGLGYPVFERDYVSEAAAAQQIQGHHGVHASTAITPPT